MPLTVIRRAICKSCKLQSYKVPHVPSRLTKKKKKRRAKKNRDGNIKYKE